MFVEIGERQTGKTYRMLKDIIKFLESNPDFEVNLVSSKKIWAIDIKDKMLNKNGKFPNWKIPNKQILKSVLVNTKMIEHPLVKNYVDEFAFIKPDKLFIDYNAYYCTTLTDDKYKYDKTYEIISEYRKYKIDLILNEKDQD